MSQMISKNEIEALEAKIKALEAKNAELEAKKSPRTIKGTLCQFTNQKGEVIKGYGQKYIVCRMNGKLHYKEYSQVTFLEKEKES